MVKNRRKRRQPQNHGRTRRLAMYEDPTWVKTYAQLRQDLGAPPTPAPA